MNSIPSPWLNQVFWPLLIQASGVLACARPTRVVARALKKLTTGPVVWMLVCSVCPPVRCSSEHERSRAHGQTASGQLMSCRPLQTGLFLLQQQQQSESSPMTGRRQANFGLRTARRPPARANRKLVLATMFVAGSLESSGVGGASLYFVIAIYCSDWSTRWGRRSRSESRRMESTNKASGCANSNQHYTDFAIPIPILIPIPIPMRRTATLTNRNYIFICAHNTRAPPAL